MIIRETSDLARLVRDRRRELGLSQEELANIAGIHRVTIGIFERGERPGSVGTVLTLLHALGMDLEVNARGR
jgi:transcriptional regulator with XRE-family HTH domain